MTNSKPVRITVSCALQVIFSRVPVMLHSVVVLPHRPSSLSPVVVSLQGSVQRKSTEVS